MHQKNQNSFGSLTIRSASTIFFVALLSYPLQAQEKSSLIWPQFRGTNGSGVYETTVLPKGIGPDVTVIWKKQIPVNGFGGSGASPAK